MADTSCRTSPFCIVCCLSQPLHISQDLLQAPAAPHLYCEPKICHPKAHLWIPQHPQPHLISITTPCGANKRRWPAGINITVHQSYLSDDLAGIPLYKHNPTFHPYAICFSVTGQMLGSLFCCSLRTAPNIFCLQSSMISSALP